VGINSKVKYARIFTPKPNWFFLHKRRKISRWNSKLQHAKFVSFFEHRVYSSRCAFFCTYVSAVWSARNACSSSCTTSTSMLSRRKSRWKRDSRSQRYSDPSLWDKSHTHSIVYGRDGREWTNLNRSVRWLTSNENWSLSFFSLNTVVTLTNKRQWWWLG